MSDAASRPLTLPLVYPITDARISGLSHAEQTRRFIEGGARLIQLREKYAHPREFYEDALRATRFARDHGAMIIINDRVDIALAVDADGVHLGQTDMPPADARRITGPQMIIGYSTHTLEQAQAAAAMPVDYVAIGPVFATSTKENPDAVIGTEGVAAVRNSLSKLPLVAIGGIWPGSAESVVRAGADSVAMISSLLQDPGKIATSYRKLQDILQNAVWRR